MKIPLERGEKIITSELFDWFKVHRKDLSFAQLQYYDSIKKQMLERRPLTERQISVLKRIKQHHEPDKELIIRQGY